jgi:Flp pilus assembly protein TadD
MKQALETERSYDFLLRHGEVLVGLKRFAEAVQVLAQAASQRPHESYALQYLGMAHMGLNEFRNASECFEKATQIGPRYPHSHYLRAQALDALGNREDAVEAATRAAELGAKSRHSEEYKAYLRTLKEKEQKLA